MKRVQKENEKKIEKLKNQQEVEEKLIKFSNVKPPQLISAIDKYLKSLEKVFSMISDCRNIEFDEILIESSELIENSKEKMINFNLLKSPIYQRGLNFGKEKFFILIFFWK